MNRICATSAMLSILLVPAAVRGQTPFISKGGIVSAASFTAGAAQAPGSLVSIFGSGFGPLAQADTIPLSTSLANVSVSFGSVAAPLSFVTDGQINAQVPWEVAGSGTVNVVVTRNGVPSAPEPLTINPFSPGVFASNGHALAIIATDPNDPRYGQLAAAPGSIPGLTTSRAHPNDVLIIYANGLGPVSPAPQTGNNSLDKLRQATTPPTVLFSNLPGNLIFAGLSPQFVGVYQVNASVPSVTASDTVPLQMQVGGFTSPVTGAAIAVSAN